MKDLIVVGASGFGMEVLWLAERCGRSVYGFLDDTPEKQGALVLGRPVLGKISSWLQYDNCDFILAIGSPRGRRAVANKMESTGTPSYATLVDPDAIIGKNITIREGVIICAGSICTASIEIGRHTIINLNCTVGHESALGEFCTIAPSVSISGNTKMGDIVEVGTGAKIREKVSIATGCVIGMGSVLTKNTAENKVLVGNPARTIKTVE